VPSLEDELKNGVPQPTLVFVGEQATGGEPEGGGTSKEAAACFEEVMQNAKAVLVPEAKRLLPWQNPEAVVDALADFLGNA
jgi:pimeloyl-ACP methyl ester carboxylesterase